MARPPTPDLPVEAAPVIWLLFSGFTNVSFWRWSFGTQPRGRRKCGRCCRTKSSFQNNESASFSLSTAFSLRLMTRIFFLGWNSHSHRITSRHSHDAPISRDFSITMSRWSSIAERISTVASSWNAHGTNGPTSSPNLAGLNCHTNTLMKNRQSRRHISRTAALARAEVRQLARTRRR